MRLVEDQQITEVSIVRDFQINSKKVEGTKEDDQLISLIKRARSGRLKLRKSS